MTVPDTPNQSASRFIMAIKEATSTTENQTEIQLWPEVLFSEDENTARITLQGKTIELDLPLRIGHILDFMHSMTAHGGKETPSRYALGPNNRIIYNRKERFLTISGEDDPVFVTDKEYGILDFLIDLSPKAATKDMLLTQIWEMRSDIETHTVETHIYRLRQKIESNASNPEVLVTSEQGYILNFTEVEEKNT